jgi:hypothetical protein
MTIVRFTRHQLANLKQQIGILNSSECQCRPDLQAIVEEENLPTIVGEDSPLENRLLKEDVLNYLLI